MGRWRELAVSRPGVGVEVDVDDDVVEGADGDGDGLLEHVVVDGSVTVDVRSGRRSQVCRQRFLIGGVEG
jgi:hypothetical protein